MRRHIDIISESLRLSHSVVQQVLDVLENKHRAAYSIDSYYAQMGVEPDEVADELEGEIYDAEARVAGHIQNGHITLYREITAPRDWDHRLETRPHLYWAYSAKNAHAHWGEDTDDIRWLITAQVTEQEIDWVNTLARNANPMLADEAEVCLLGGATPQIISAEPRPDGYKTDFF